MSDQDALGPGVTIVTAEEWGGPGSPSCTHKTPGSDRSCRYDAVVVVEAPDETIGACHLHARQDWLEEAGVDE